MPGRHYTVIYELAKEGGFYAHIPPLDLTTEGETLDEAKEMARDVIENTFFDCFVPPNSTTPTVLTCGGRYCLAYSCSYYGKEIKEGTAEPISWAEFKKLLNN